VAGAAFQALVLQKVDVEEDDKVAVRAWVRAWVHA